MASSHDSKHPNHPVNISGAFDIIQSLPPVLEEGKTYGQFPHVSSIAFYAPNTSEILEHEQNVIVTVSGYAVDASTLKDDNVYVLHGRFVPHPDYPEDPTPVVFFDPDAILNVGPKAAYVNALAGNVNVKGLGVVLERFNVEVPGPKKSKTNNLHVVVQHTDYDNLRKDKTSFEIMYIVPGTRLQGKTHGLYQIGRELHVTGQIRGYNVARNLWEVHVTGVSVPSGNQLNPPTPHKDLTVASDHRRPNLIKIGAMQGAPLPKAKNKSEMRSRGPQSTLETVVRGLPNEIQPSSLDPTPSAADTSQSHLNETNEIEDGEVEGPPKSSAYELSQSSSGPKRTPSKILLDAAKRLKTLT